MRWLLDTHVMVWWLADDETLSDDLKNMIDTETDVFVSPVSVWEIGIQVSTGKFIAPPDLVSIIQGQGLAVMPILATHAEEAGALPLIHRDPFDRMLVAQARCEGLTVMTRDTLIPQYDVAVLAA